MKGLRWVGSLLGLVAVLLSAGCGNDTELRWKEEVKLADGRIIVVTRRSEFKSPHEIGQPPGESHMWMEFEHPVAKEMVRFESKLGLDSSEKVGASKKIEGVQEFAQYPYALMVNQNDLYVVTKPLANIYRFLGCPDPPFVLYLWRQNHWERRPLEEIPQRKFVPNLNVDPLTTRSRIKASNYYIKVSESNFNDHGLPEFDLSGMTRQTFELPPNCATCTVWEQVGLQANSPSAGPFCTRLERVWVKNNHLTN